MRAIILALFLGSALFCGTGCKKATAKLSPQGLHLTAISLGKPRLAIINGQQLGEGDLVKSAAGKLRISKISDGEIELSDGTQTITAYLEAAAPPRAKR
jgi:hypothetical protein